MLYVKVDINVIAVIISQVLLDYAKVVSMNGKHWKRNYTTGREIDAK